MRFAYGVRLAVCRLIYAPHLGHASAALYLGLWWWVGGFLKTGSKKPRSGGSFSWQLCVLDIAHFFKGILRDWSGVSVGGDVTSVSKRGCWL